MQQAYINAFTHLHQFEERSQFSTWLIRIALHEAFGRRRKMRLSESLARIRSDDDDRGEFMDTLTSPQADPERQAYAQELHRVLEAAVDTLPETYRTVFMLRDIEGLSTSETGEGLGLGRGSGEDPFASRACNDSARRDRADWRGGHGGVPVSRPTLRSHRVGSVSEDLSVLVGVTPSTQQHGPLSGPRYRGSNPCLPANSRFPRFPLAIQTVFTPKRPK